MRVLIDVVSFRSHFLHLFSTHAAPISLKSLLPHSGHRPFCLHLEQKISLHFLHSYIFKAALKERLCPLLGHASNTAIYMHLLGAFHFHNASPLAPHSAIALFRHGDTTFAWHDVSLKFGIKDCFFLGRMRTLGFRATPFVSASHIISSALLYIPSRLS